MSAVKDTDEKRHIVAETAAAGGWDCRGCPSARYQLRLLWNWRSQMLRGLLRADPPNVFVAVQVVDELLPASEQPKCVESVAIAPVSTAPAEREIEIRLSDGTSIRVGGEVSLTTLRRVVAALRG